MAQDLMTPHQRARREAEKADRIADQARAARLDHRLIERDIGPAAAQSRVDDAEMRIHDGIFWIFSEGQSCLRIFSRSRRLGAKG